MNWNLIPNFADLIRNWKTKMSIKKEKGIREFPVHTTNPYLPNLIVPSKKRTISIASDKSLGLLDFETGVITDTAFIGIRKRVDSEEFVKIFKGQIQALFELSTAAMRVFGYFMDATRFGKDSIYFSIKECMQYTKYKSQNSINIGISELLAKEFVAKSDKQNIFFINPSKFFNGDRMVMFNDYIKKGTSADKRYLEQMQQIETTAKDEGIKIEHLANNESDLDKAERQTLNEQTD